MPTMRARDSDEEEAEDDDEQCGGEVGERADLRAGDGLELEEEEHEQDERGAPPKTTDGGRSCSVREGAAADAERFVADLFEALGEGAEDGGQGAEEGDEAGGGDCSRAHGADVGAPEIGGRHCAMGTVPG